MTTSRMGIMGSLRVSNFSLIWVTRVAFLGCGCMANSSSNVLVKDYHARQVSRAAVFVCKSWYGCGINKLRAERAYRGNPSIKESHPWLFTHGKGWETGAIRRSR